jgi:hypothetical protein
MSRIPAALRRLGSLKRYRAILVILGSVENALWYTANPKAALVVACRALTDLFGGT